MVLTETGADNFLDRSAGRPNGEALATHSDLRVVVTPPPSASYDATTFGPSMRSVGIRLTNVGNSRVDIAGLGAVFTAKRNDVKFQCVSRPREMDRTHEPSWLAPGQSYSFDRDINCLMPLPGHYEIGVFITFDKPSARSSADFAEAFAFDVLPSAGAPRAYPARDGLYVVMAGAAVTLPLSPEAWARGDYHVVVAIINGNSRPVVAGPARLTFLTYRGASSLPCSGAAEPLMFPAKVDPGTMVTMAAAVACAPSEEGTYEIVGHLAFGKNEAEIEIGRIPLTVTSDPTFFTPGFRLWPTDLTQLPQRSSPAQQIVLTE